MTDVADGIAVVGMAGRFPKSADLGELWANLRAGVECISFFSDPELAAAGLDRTTLARPDFVKAHGAIDGVELFDAGFFDMTPREAEVLDPQKRLFLECAWQAIEHAGYDPARPPGPVGLFAGVTNSTYLFNNLLANPGLASAAGLDQIALGNGQDFLTTLVSYKLDLQGPSVDVQTACSTSLVAVHLACQSLLDFQCDMALAGGVSVKVPQQGGHLYQQGGILSPDGHCRAFDARAEGTVGGSGAGVVVLRRLEDALAGGDRIWAVILGSAMNNDGATKVGYSAPSVEGQSKVIATALALAGVDVESITYVEAHGTGTPLGDPIEVAALDRVFRRRTAKRGFCALGSVKTNLGHLDAAAGIAGLIKTVLALEHRQIPPSLHYTAPNPQIDLGGSSFYVNTALAEWRCTGPRRAGVSSFGIGGTNVHMVLEEAPARVQASPAPGWQLLLLAARTEAALESATHRLAAHLRQHPVQELADVAWTLQAGRHRFACRRAVVCRNREEAAAALEARSPRQVWSGGAPSLGERPVTFLFPGLGDHYPGMARGLYASVPAFREELDRSLKTAHERLGLDLRGALFPAGAAAAEEARNGSGDPGGEANLRRMLGRGAEERREPDSLGRTVLAQPAVFAVEVALARLLMARGLRPESMIGYSLGEYAAACLAGVLSLEDALLVVAERARMIEELPAGGMLAVSLSAAAVAPLLTGGLCLAAVNGPEVSVVAGPAAAVGALAERLAAEGIPARRLPVAHAFHSEMMEPVRSRLVRLLEGVRLQAPEVPFVSNVTGTWIRPEEAVDPAYWARHLCQTVRFSDGLAELLREPARVFVEVGPGASLSALLLQHPAAGRGHVAVPALRHEWDRQPDEAFLLEGLGKLWLAGVEMEWPAFHAGERRRVPLPTYPFERRRYWVEPAAAPAGHAARGGKSPDLAEWFYAPVWRESVLPPAAEPGAEADWLLFTDRSGVGDALASRLRERGRVVTVEAGDGFARLGPGRYRLDPARPEDYVALVGDLTAGGLPRRIVHLWSVGPPASGNPAAAEACQETGFLSLLALAQALATRSAQQPLELTVVADGLHAVLGGERLQAAKATVIGPCLVIPREDSGILCRCVDLDLAGGAAANVEQAAAALLRELAFPPAERIVAWRGGRRWLQDFQPVRLEGARAEKPAGTAAGLPRVRHGGTYLITGGTGGIGLELAALLAREAGARLALVGRSGLPPRETWDAWLAAHGALDRTSRRIARVRDVEALGGEVMVLAADVADREQMREALRQVRVRLGPIHGAVHAAGTAAGGLIALRTAAGARETLAPKVAGTLVLADLLRGEPLDFLVLCSSLSSILGGLGQADYCAANAFLDAFARQAAASGGPLTVAVGWDTWREVGMAVEVDSTEELRRLREQHLRFAIEPAEGIEVFRRVLAHPLPWIAVSTQHLPSLIAWAHRPHGGDEELEPGAEPMAAHARPGLAQAYTPPRNDLEQRLAAIWQEVLGLEAVGIHDPFPELGGHSLLAMRVASKVQKLFGVHLSLRALFEAPTIAELAVLVVGETAREAGEGERSPAEADEIRPLAAGRGRYPLSFAQQRLWFLDRLQPGNAAYNIAEGLRLTGPLDGGALAAALAEVVRRHSVLRAAFDLEDGEPVQVIAPFQGLALPVVDLSALAPDRQAELEHLAAAETGRPFDLARGPLHRFLLVRLGGADHALLIALHHAAADAWSMEILFDELRVLYRSFAAGRPSPLPELPVQYADFSAWQRNWLQGERLERQLAYWRQRLAEAPTAFDLPTDRPRPTVQTYVGARCSVVLPPRLASALRELAQRQGATVFMALLAGFAALLFRATAQEQILVGSPIANRERPEVERLIGFFVNTLVVRCDLSGLPSFRALLARVREAVLGGFAHADVPFERIVEDLHPERDPGRTPLFQVLFALLAAGPPTGAELSTGLAVGKVSIPGRSAKFDLNLSVFDGGEGIDGSFEYNSDLFDAATVARLAAHFECLLESAVAHSAAPVPDLACLRAAERHQLLLEWSGSPPAGPEASTLAARFAAQVARTPDAPAAVYEDEALTFRELNARANQLAWSLRRLGVGPEVCAGIYMERSLDLLVAVLGVLKAGGAYLPLDPRFPPERLTFMMEDSRAAVLLTQEHLRPTLPAQAARVLCLDASRRALAAESREDPPGAGFPESLAYVIYTSGSTGRPKGVQVENRQVLAYVRAAAGRLGLAAGASYAMLQPLAVDSCKTVLFPPLLLGGCLHLIASLRAADPEALGDYFARHGIDVLKIAPSHLAALQTSARPARVLPRRCLVVGGEASRRDWAEGLLRQAPGCRVFNHYGPTEATVGVLAFRLLEEARFATRTVPLGRPLDDARCRVLDDRVRPVPAGVAGELYIGGECVARGYLGRPGLTAERFVPDPFAAGPGERLYRTGDLVRFLADGAIEFLGRLDHQVKIRGFRIEPGEVETLLLRHPGVGEAVVVPRQDGTGEPRLVAYVVAAAGGEAPAAGELRACLAPQLPDYMVPTAFVLLPELPRTAHGKLDRSALPAPDSARGTARAPALGPRDMIELQLVRIWEELLGVQSLGVRDDFFELGGHSLLAVRLMSRVEQRFGRSLPLSLLFGGATVEALARVLRRDLGAAGTPSPLVEIQPGDGSRRPLFLVHPAGGNVFCYLRLAGHLGREQPVFGLADPNTCGTAEPSFAIGEMAALYIAAMRQLQPRGPYLLGGWSLGGVLAQEMARRLEQQGERVAALFLIDARPASPARQHSEDDLLAWFADQLGMPEAAAGLDALPAPERFSSLLAAAQRNGRLPDDLEPSAARRIFDVFRAEMSAERGHEAGSCDCPALLLRAQAGVESELAQGADPALGWQRLAPALEVRVVPGSHQTVLDEPQVGGLAREIRARLDAAAVTESERE